jgi:hypothetical protein
LFLKVEHPSVCFLCTNILLPFFFLIDFLDIQIFLILFKHLKEVLLFLSLFLHLYDSLCLHFSLKSLKLLDFGLKTLSGLLSLFVFHLLKLGISRYLLLEYFFGDGSLFFLFSFFEQNQMLSLCFIILLILSLQRLLFLLLSLTLTIQLNLHESFPLSFTSGRLFLLFEMEEGVELLDGSPFVFFFEVRI